MCSTQNADKRHFWCLSFSYMTISHFTLIIQQLFHFFPLRGKQSGRIIEEPEL